MDGRGWKKSRVSKVDLKVRVSRASPVAFIARYLLPSVRFSRSSGFQRENFVSAFTPLDTFEIAAT